MKNSHMKLCVLSFAMIAALAGVCTEAPKPLLPGFHPDPSVCLGHDGAYYLVTSTFMWRPGLPIYRSENFRDWSFAGHALGPQYTSVDSNAEGCGPLSGDDGVWAPTIRFRHGTYYIAFTYSGNGFRNYLTTAKDPAGPWTEPVHVEGADGGIDPSIFFDDDGKAYWTQNVPAREGKWVGHNEIFVQEIDLAACKLVGRREYISCGVFPKAEYTEGPHIYKIHGEYVLLHAEGGTGFYHAETAKKSKSVWGPYEPMRTNPLVTRRDRGAGSPLQATGHADIVKMKDGGDDDYYAVFLGKRPLGEDRRVLLGRETFACPARWRDGDLVFLHEQLIAGNVVESKGTCVVADGVFVRRVTGIAFDETVVAGEGESMILWRGKEGNIQLAGPGELRMVSEDGLSVKCYKNGAFVKEVDTKIVSDGQTANRFNGLGVGKVKSAPNRTLSLFWPEPTREMKPWAYNWWMGSAVDKAGLEYQCRELADKGFGGFHVIPIYGAKGGYEKNWKPLLSPQWIEAWNLAAGLASHYGLGIDLTMGAGWCFGGPWIDKEHAASSGMKVKRAGLGGEGYMLDPFDPEAMKLHVAQYDKWFGKAAQSVTCDGLASADADILVAMPPRAFYHDSYEYYGAKPKNGGDVDESQLACFKVWTDWCRENGYLTRNEAHGAPSNWLDFYALADIPETEMFGKNDRDILISKFASSAAHVKGTKLVSSESCTWIDEHFCERPQEIKMFIDRLFLSGVNHMFFHGCCYSPVEAVWPGWCFYASIEMNPRNPIWREMGAMNKYITRCQSLFQTWTPDNDLAILWDPTSFREKHKGEVAQMTVHNREWFYGEKIGKVATELYEAGYAFDYVSPRMVKDGLAKKYAVVVDPEAPRYELLKSVRKMPFDAKSGLLATRLKKDGETAYFVVNTGTVARVVAAGGKPYGLMNPLSGNIETARREAVEVAPGHSLFLVGDGFEVTAAGERTCCGIAVAGPWEVSPICGGPALPAPRKLDALVGWETFDKFFSGTMLYKTEFDASKGTSLSLGEVREIARVKLNGRDLGVRFMPPYDFPIPAGVLKEKGNVLEVEVTNLGSNRLRWNDLNKVDWKYFTDINMVDMNYQKLDASKRPVLKSGLVGPVVITRQEHCLSPMK